jgi:hypothetical protein
VYNEPGDAEYRANRLMHHATSRIATMASKYASQVPLPASAATSGIVAAGVEVGAIVETDWPSVSIGESASPRNPYSPVLIWMDPACPVVAESEACLSGSVRLGMLYDTRAARLAQGLPAKLGI